MYTEKIAKTISAFTQIENTTVVNMYAQKTTDGDVNTNITIQSPTLYDRYKTECDADITTFKAHVEEL